MTTEIGLGIRPQFTRFEMGKIYGKNKVEDYTEAKKFRGIYVEDTERIVCVATDEYHVVQHENVYNAFEQAVRGLASDITSKGVDCKTEFAKDNMRMYIMADFPGKVIEPVPGEILGFGLVVMNSVDGTTGINVMPYTRNLSENWMMTHREKIRNVGTFKKHTSQANEVLRALPLSITNSFQHLHYLEKLYKEWGLTPVDVDKLVEDMQKVESGEVNTKGLPLKYLEELVAEQSKIRTRWDYFQFLARHNWNDDKRGIEAKLTFNTKIMKLVETAPAQTSRINLVAEGFDYRSNF